MDFASFPLLLKRLTDNGQISGLAAGYGNVDYCGDIFAPGCFAASLAEQKAQRRSPAMLLYHDASRPVGRWESFNETEEGLQAEGRLSLGVGDGKEAYELLKDGAIGGLSVGYIITKRDSADQRVITSAELLEVSLVPVPANPRARVEAVKAVRTVRDIEELFREVGFSNRNAKAAASAAWRAIQNQSDEPAATAKIARILASSTERLRA